MTSEENQAQLKRRLSRTDAVKPQAEILELEANF